MKKIIAGIIAAVLICTAAGCSNSADGGVASGSVRIVCTIFPEYDWVRQIVGSRSDKVDIKLLLDNGVDLHSYQPTAADIVAICSADIFIYAGGASDAWAGDALKNATNSDMAVINLISILGDKVKEEELTEGMEAEEETDETDSGEPEYDEHVWLSLKNAQMYCAEIADRLCAADPDGADEYKANLAAYSAQLSQLDSSFSASAAAAQHKTLVFGDRFPFRYLFDDYGLSYFAAFPGCSAETEASFETVAFLAGKVDELSLGSVMAIEGAQHKIADTIISSTADKNQQVLTLNSMQSVTTKDIDAGTAYLSVMRDNLDTLAAAIK